MIVTGRVAIVYNHARRAKQGVVLKRGRWSGHHYFEPPGQAEDSKEGGVQFLEKRPPTFTGRKEPPVNFEFSDKVQKLQGRLQAFLDEHVYPNEPRFYNEIEQNRWTPTRIIEELKPMARAAGLWNLFLPDSKQGAGLTNLEYAPLCEMMGGSVMAPEVKQIRC